MRSLEDDLQALLVKHGLVGGTLIAIQFIDRNLVGSITTVCLEELEPNLTRCVINIGENVKLQNRLNLKVNYHA